MWGSPVTLAVLIIPVKITKINRGNCLQRTVNYSRRASMTLCLSYQGCN